MKVRHLLIIALFLGGCIFPSAFSTLQAAAPDWLSDAWRTTFYPSSTYFTGFAVYQKSKETKADALRKAEEAARVDAAATIRVKIANESVVIGDIRAREVYVDGAIIRGNIICDQTVQISEKSVIIGELRAEAAFIAGAVKGNIDITNSVILDSTANSFTKSVLFL